MKKNSISKGVAVGVGVAAVVATIAGTYFFYGSKDAVKNRKRVKAWTFKAKSEVLEQLEKISEVSEEVYHKIVEEVANKYKLLKKINENDVADFKKELKSHWKNIAKELGISKKN
jgi:TRAP-type mannitol/chloroaromatic compound transport system substrate-binding protein